ncbi:ferredoxin [Mycobacterium sp.]|uniref:ferredoxin n=1 Tax=Mycobacterium sp. TaxID=1785 RepID=UPI0025D4A26E|nr:ferredoxin [Mycobacterium sp.]
MSGRIIRVRVDPELCMGHGQCYTRAPQVYEPDDEGFCVVIESQVEGDLLLHAIEGAEACPESAISVTEASRAGTPASESER